MSFIGFVNTITTSNTVLPYGIFVRSIDLTPVNKYGIDMRAQRLMHCCPYIGEMTLGHPTTIKTETIREIAKYNNRLHTLSIGGIESFPFMLDCDFSHLTRLRHVSLTTTPLMTSSFMTLPMLSSLQLIRMDAMTPEDLLLFCQTHQKLQSLAIINCKKLLTNGLGEVLARLITPHDTAYCIELRQIELVGHNVTDECLAGLFNKVPKGSRLAMLNLFSTSVTPQFIHPILLHDSCSSLHVDKIQLMDNRYLS